MTSCSDRPQSLGEEIANSAIHGAALLATIVAVPFLIGSVRHVSVLHVTGTCVFAITMVLLYLTSTLYHSLPSGRAKHAILKLDHGAIYFFIAGSYTPFALGAVNGYWGWLLLGLVWSLALLGATLKVLDRLSHPWLSTGLYLAMGWLVLIAAVPLVEHIPHQGLVLLVSGGVAYTVGVLFYTLDSRLRYSHAVWHCFVVVGTGCHLSAVLSYGVHSL